MVSSSLPRGYVGYSLSHEVILIAFGSAFDADCAASAANCPDSDRGRVCEPLSVSEAISCARSFDLHASSMRQSNSATYAVPMTYVRQRKESGFGAALLAVSNGRQLKLLRVTLSILIIRIACRYV